MAESTEEVDLEMLLFQIIANVGGARSNYVEAVHEARSGNLERAREMIEEGEKMFLVGHDAHLQVFTRELTADEMRYMPLIIHAEDQLMSAETMKAMCEEFIDVHEDLRRALAARAPR